MKKQHMIFLTFVLLTSLLMWGCAEETVEVTPQTEEQATVKERRRANSSTRIVCEPYKRDGWRSCNRKKLGICNCRFTIGGGASTSAVGGIGSVNGNHFRIVFTDDYFTSYTEIPYESGQQTEIEDLIANDLGYDYIIVQPGENVPIEFDDEECLNGCVDLLIIDSQELEGE